VPSSLERLLGRDTALMRNEKYNRNRNSAGLDIASTPQSAASCQATRLSSFANALYFAERIG
jgi:hypothetical protein